MRKPLTDSDLPKDAYLAERVMKIRNIGRRALADSLMIGKLLWECKQRIQHGQWEKFCATYFQVQFQSINRFVRAYLFSETDNGKTLIGFGASWFVLTLLCCKGDEDIEAVLAHAREFAMVPKASVVQDILRTRGSHGPSRAASRKRGKVDSAAAVKAVLDEAVTTDLLNPIKRWIRNTRPRVNFCELGEAAKALIDDEIVRRRNVAVVPVTEAATPVQLSMVMSGPEAA